MKRRILEHVLSFVFWDTTISIGTGRNRKERRDFKFNRMR